MVIMSGLVSIKSKTLCILILKNLMNTNDKPSKFMPMDEVA